MQCIENDCIEITGAPKAMIFFTKLQADIARYLCEHSSSKQLDFRNTANNLYARANYMQRLDRDNKM